MPVVQQRSTSEEEEAPVERQPFPAWLRELCFFGGLLVTLTVFGQNLKSEQRSTREEMTRMAGDLAAIRSSLPNKEVYDLKLAEIDKRLTKLDSDLTFEAAKSQNLRERLMKKGWVD